MASSPELATQYERLRQLALGSGDDHPLGMAVVLRQGLWAWMVLVAARPADGIAAARTNVPSLSASLSASLPLFPPATLRHELVLAWTNLVVGAVTHQEVHP